MARGIEQHDGRHGAGGVKMAGHSRCERSSIEVKCGGGALAMVRDAARHPRRIDEW